jgi:hypothetical protein
VKEKITKLKVQRKPFWQKLVGRLRLAYFEVGNGKKIERRGKRLFPLPL